MRYPCASFRAGHNGRVSTHDPGPGDVDWLDLGPDPDEGKPPADPRRRYLWYGGAAALVVALLLTRAQHGTNQAATTPRSSSPAVSPSSASVPAAVADPATSGSFASPSEPGPLPTDLPVQVSAGHRLLDVPADWELFARGEDTLIRIRLALGRATITAIPRLNPGTSAIVVVGADRAIVRPADNTPPFVVRDGKPATDLPQSLRQSYLLLPGPDSRHLWVEGSEGLSLVTLDGKPTGATIDVPPMGSVQGADGTGYALVTGIAGGAYLAKPGAIHRITSGQLLASGPTRWLTTECDDSLNCALVAIDRASGAHHTVESALDSYGQNLGMISPDGKTVATQRSDGISSAGIDLYDLDSALHRPVDVNPNGVNQPDGPSFVWSPDSRWLFTVNAGGQVMVVNRATGKATPLSMDLPQVLQLAFRHRTG
jgi:hypothetical protein